MTSQDQDRNELNDKAKRLGIKSPHTCGLDTLLTKIAEAENMLKEEPAKQVAEVAEETPEQPEKPVRRKAPSMSVANIDRDDRTALIEELEAEDPECKYIFQSGTISDRALKAKGLERTEHTLKGDVVCRTMKDSYLAVKYARQKADYEAMKRVDADKGIIGNLQQQRKEPRS